MGVTDETNDEQAKLWKGIGGQGGVEAQAVLDQTPGSRRADPRADLRNGSRGRQSVRSGNRSSFQRGVLDGGCARVSPRGARFLTIARMPGVGRKVINGSGRMS